MTAKMIFVFSLATTTLFLGCDNYRATSRPTPVDRCLPLPFETRPVNARQHFHDSRPGFNRDHVGTDYDVRQGTPLQATFSGTIVAASKDTRGANVVIIETSWVFIKYGHLSRVDVREGDRVEPGSPLGNSGGRPGTEGAGYSTGQHLHVEVVDYRGQYLDPESVFCHQ